MAPTFTGDDEDDTHEMKQHVTDELSLMLGVAKPTALERILEDKRLKIVAVREREHRKQAQEEAEMLVHSKRDQVIHPDSHVKLTREQQEKQEKQARERERLEKKKKRLLTMPVPSTFMIRDGELLEDGGAVAASPPWVTEIVGEALGVAIAAKMKEQAVDAQLLKHFDHDAWKVLGVSDPIQRAKLVRRAQARNAVVFAPPQVSTNLKAQPGKSGDLWGSMENDDISDLLDEVTETVVPVNDISDMHVHASITANSVTVHGVHGAVANGGTEDATTIRPVEPDDMPSLNLPGGVPPGNF